MFDNLYYNGKYYYFNTQNNLTLYNELNKKELLLLLIIISVFKKQIKVNIKKGKGNFKKKKLKYIEYNQNYIYILDEKANFIDNIDKIGGKKNEIIIDVVNKKILNNLIFDKLYNKSIKNKLSYEELLFYLSKLEKYNE